MQYALKRCANVREKQLRARMQTFMQYRMFDDVNALLYVINLLNLWMCFLFAEISAIYPKHEMRTKHVSKHEIHEKTCLN